MPNRTVSVVLTGNNASLVSSLEGSSVAATKAGTNIEQKLGGSAGKVGLAFNALAAQASGFGVPFAASIGRVGSTLEQAEGKAASFGSTIGKIGQVEATAAAIGLVAVGTEAVHLADALEQAHAREVTAIKNAGQSYGDYAAKISKTEQQMEKFGFTNAETEDSIAKLTNATHDTGKALDLQSLAANIARGRNIDLSSATDILMKVETGHVQLLGRLGINVKDANGHIISQDEAIRRLTATYQGQAAAAADTFAGKMKTLSTTAQDLGAKLGEAIVPGVEAVATALSTGVSDFEGFNRNLDGIPGKILAVTAAFPIAVFAAEKLAAVGSKILGAFEKVGTVIDRAISGAGAAGELGTAVPAAVVAPEAVAATATVGAASAGAVEVTALEASTKAATEKGIALAALGVAEDKEALATATSAAANEKLALALADASASDAEIVTAANAAATAQERLAAATAATATAAATAAGAGTEVATTNAAAEVSYAGMTEAELGAAAASGTLSAEQLAVILTTQELEAALAGVAATSDLDAVAIERLAAADIAATEAMAALTASQEAAATAAAELAAAEDAATFSLGGLLTAATGVGAGLLLGVAGGKELNRVIGGAKPNVDDLTKSLFNLAKTGQISGTASSDLGDHLQKLAGDLKTIEGSTIEKAFGLAPSAHQAVKDIGSVNDSLKQLLATSGLKVSYQAFEDLRDKLLALGVPMSTINSEFGPYFTAVENLPAPTAKAASAVFDLGAAFDALAGKTGALAKADELSTIADKFDAVKTAQDKVASDKADIAGTSQNATDANKAEADALRGLRDANQSVSDSHQKLADSYVTLQDAQDRVKTSADTLLRAQQALDQFNSPRGAQERALQLDQIQRTVATTPSQEDAKQLSLLQFQDQNANKVQSLNDAVINGQKGVRDANKAVADAQRGIADAERGIQDATQRVADAQQNVSDAVKRRQKVHDDAAAAIAGDERKIGTAMSAVVTELEKAKAAQLINNTELGNYLTLLDGVATKADPGGVLSKNLDSLVGKMQLSAVLAQHAQDIAHPKIPNIGPYDSATYARLTQEAQPSFVGPVSAGDRALLHKAGVPGFAAGGDIEADKTVLVGEKGPELIVPKSAGTVISNDKLAAAVSHPSITLAQPKTESTATSAAVVRTPAVAAAVTVPPAKVSTATGPATVVGTNFDKALSSTASSLKLFQAALVKPPTFPTVPQPTRETQAPSVTTTFANTYHINAQGNPTRAELEYINREANWQLTRSGRR